MSSEDNADQMPPYADNSVVETPEETHAETGEPNRTRRAVYVFLITFLTLACVMYLSIYGETEIAQSVADGLITLLQITVPTYLVGHSVDRFTQNMKKD